MVSKSELSAIVKSAITEEIEKLNRPAYGATGIQPAYRQISSDDWSNFGEQLKAVHQAAIYGNPDVRLRAPTGLGEHVPSEGGFLVAQEFIDQILDKMYSTGEVASRCTRIPIGKNFNGFKIPAIDETSRADGSRWGGVRGYWTSEGGTKTASQPKFKQVSAEITKLAALCYVTDELLEDSLQLEAWINRVYPLEMGFKLDDAIINGDGAGKPLGILNSPGRVTISKETGQAADTIVTNNILKMWQRLWAPCRRNAVWFINQDIKVQLETLTIPIEGPAGHWQDCTTRLEA